jgi:hypothetical protein
MAATGEDNEGEEEEGCFSDHGTLLSGWQFL